MSRLSDCVNDIYTKVQGIPALAASTGLTLGGKEPDPGMTKIPLPAAWVLIPAGENMNTGDLENRPPTLANVRLMQDVFLHVPYLSQSDLLTNQVPLIEAVVAAIQGTSVAIGGGPRWNLHSFKMAGLNTDRVIVHLIFQLYTPLF